MSVERVQEYIDLKPEAPLEIEATQPSDDWPQSGSLKFEGISARYRENLDLVLRGIDFEVKGGQKVGVCGRTGAGKSSLTMVSLKLSTVLRRTANLELRRFCTVSSRRRLVSFPSTASTSARLVCTPFARAFPSFLKTRNASRAPSGRTSTPQERVPMLRSGRRWSSAGSRSTSSQW